MFSILVSRGLWDLPSVTPLPFCPLELCLFSIVYKSACFASFALPSFHFNPRLFPWPSILNYAFPLAASIKRSGAGCKMWATVAGSPKATQDTRELSERDEVVVVGVEDHEGVVHVILDGGGSGRRLHERGEHGQVDAAFAVGVDLLHHA